MSPSQVEPQAASVVSLFRNFRRAGMLKKRSRTSTTVPGEHPASFVSRRTPPSTTISVPDTASDSRVVRRNRDTLAMLGMAGGAVHVFTAGERWRGGAARVRLPRAALAFGLSIPVCHVANLLLPIPDLSSVTFRLTALDVASIALSTAVLAVPFVLSGVVITAGLTRMGGSIGRLYASDLIGAAAHTQQVETPLTQLFTDKIYESVDRSD